MINQELELVELRRALLTMSAAVEQRVRVVLESLIEDDYDAATEVRHGDRAIDNMELDIEASCMRILALSQPVAGDLRFILAALRINGDLERIADMAKSMAKRILKLRQTPELELPEALPQMARYCGTMLGKVLTALADEDVAAANEVRTDDARLDALEKDVFRWAHQEIPKNVEWTQGVIDLLTITRSIERIGDLATNIAEDVIFLVEGAVVRHS
jgi:phosphate transport system protein